MSGANNMNELKKWAILNVLDQELIARVRIALVFGNAGDKAIIVTQDDRVYTFGNNKGRCLGIALDVSTFVPLEVISLSGTGVIKFATGTNVLALTKSGEVYNCNQTNYTPILSLFGERVIDVACGQRYFLALNDQGEVYIWGTIENKDKKLTTIPTTKLTTQFEDDNIISITSELNSILALTRTGLVYQWNPSTDSIDHTPQRVGDLVNIVKLVSGYNHTMASDEEGSLYIWGSNEYGQFGNGRAIPNIGPYKVLSQLVGHIVDMAAGEYISAAVNQKGQVYMWGQCLGQKILLPTFVPLSNVDDVILYFSSNNGMRESREFHEMKDTSLLRCIQQNFDNPVTSDIKIKAQEKTIYVHKAILRLRSAHFKRMFNGDWKEKDQSIIHQSQYFYDVYKAFLQYLYTGNVEASAEQLTQLKKLANQYLDTELEELCDQMILQNKKQEKTSNVYELKKWPILNLLESKLIAQVRMAYIFGKSGNEAIIITNDDKVYGLGTNENGCLGIGIRTNTLHPTEVEVLSGKGVIKLAIGNIGEHHVLALTKTGKVYAWGRNCFGELGIGSLGEQWTPIQIAHELSEKKMIDIACGSRTSLALSDEGKVSQWGYNAAFDSYTQTPMDNLSEFLNRGNVKAIACMSYLRIAVTESGEIYCWGRNYKPYTLEIESDRFKTPEKIVELGEFDIVKIVAGHYHLLVLGKDGSLQIWGRNLHGELGCGNICNDWTLYKMPKLTMGPIVDIAAGLYTSAALNQKGEVFMWGRCRGQNLLIPTRTEFSNLSDVRLYFASSNNLYTHLDLTVGGRINVLESIEQGFDDSTTSDLVIKVEDEPIYVHKVLLEIRSSYCEKMLKTEWAGKNPIIITNQYSYAIYKSFFKYLYTDKVDVSPANLKELMDLASEFSDARLTNLCANLVEKNLRYKRHNFVSYNHLIQS